jgi:hypothetical protein
MFTASPDDIHAATFVSHRTLRYTPPRLCHIERSDKCHCVAGQHTHRHICATSDSPIDVYCVAGQHTRQPRLWYVGRCDKCSLHRRTTYAPPRLWYVGRSDKCLLCRRTTYTPPRLCYIGRSDKCALCRRTTYTPPRLWYIGRPDKCALHRRTTYAPPRFVVRRTLR